MGQRGQGRGTGLQGIQERNAKNKTVALCLQGYVKESVLNGIQGAMKLIGWPAPLPLGQRIQV